ncbi:hypothetical protein MTO96_006227, partial [Rhipicephalus appendiculatus]
EGDEEVSLNDMQFCALKPVYQAPTKTQTPGTTGKPGPPRDTNPDCNAWKKNLTNYLYHSCMFACEGDEEIPLSNKQSCVLHSTSKQDTKNHVNGGDLGTVEMGYCKDGKCVRLDNKSPVTTGKPQPPKDKNPDCYAWKKNQTDYLYHSCTFVCQLDEEVPLNNKQSCVLKPASGSLSKHPGQGGRAGNCRHWTLRGWKIVLPGGRIELIISITPAHSPAKETKEWLCKINNLVW